MSLVVNPEFILDLESRMQLITSRAYDSIDRALWWRDVCKVRPTMSGREILFWLLDTAQIEYETEGNVQFEELSFQRAEYAAKYAGRGLKVLKSQFEDQDGNGVNVAREWSRQIGAYAAYFPQKQAARVLNSGETFKGYDGKPLFATDHPVDPFNPSAGEYSNLLTTGIHLDDSNEIDVAFDSLSVVFKSIRAVKSPNGEDPRILIPKFFLSPPAMVPRLTTLLSAKFISMKAGSTDVQGVVESMGFSGGVKQAPELGSAFGGDDTSCYLVCEEIGSPDLDPLVWIEREAFQVQYYSGQDGGAMSAALGRSRQLEWHVHGRNSMNAGHPFKIFKLKSTKKV